MKFVFFGALGGLFATAASAEVPRVTVDIAPVYSLAARVLEGVGTPELIVPANASPHYYSMKPSNARAIQNASHVFVLDEGLTPWIMSTLESIGPNSDVTLLSDVEGTTLLPNRDMVDFANADEEHDDHGHDDSHADAHNDHDGEHGHDDDHNDDEYHDDHRDEEEHDHDEHEEPDDHAHHDHGDHDPHTWLDPENAILWLGVMAEKFAAYDPENAEIYLANAQAGQEEIQALSDEIADQIASLGPVKFVVNHDAFQYFEARFGVSSEGAISFTDSSDPGPAHIAELSERISESGVTCILTEVGGRQVLIDTVFEGADASVNAVDPLGVEAPLDATLYPYVLKTLADGLKACKA